LEHEEFEADHCCNDGVDGRAVIPVDHRNVDETRRESDDRAGVGIRRRTRSAASTGPEKATSVGSGEGVGHDRRFDTARERLPVPAVVAQFEPAASSTARRGA
jgi:hypothetical protein